MEARCVARWIRITPRKMRLVVDLVRGKSVNEAIGILKFTPRAGARPTLKAIQSAVANIVDRDDKREINPDELVVKRIFVDEGPTLRRFLPRAMGRATSLLKRSCHITVDVATPEIKAAPVAEPEEEQKPKKRVVAKKPAAAKGKGKAKAKAAPKKRPAGKKKTE